ncbi:YjzD family protein [Bacillus sp. FJAT-52991]|uniref:YjzD family protein n=1 Tax=Bacillus kandeliae TaxID=3129297 RepID=A0ABZ2N9N9_9BACI
MQYIMTFFWTFLLIEMLTYVVCSMNGITFTIATMGMTGLIISVIVTILLFVLSALIPNDPVEHH